MRFCNLALAVALLAAGLARAQRAQLDPPVQGRPINFSNIVGKFDLKVVAAPATVHVAEPIHLKIEITGEGPGQYEPRRKYLQLFPKDFERDFYVLPLPEEDRVDRAAKTWLFAYRLKPKHAKIEAIDGITLVLYDPDHPGKNKFVKRFAEAIPINVLPKTGVTEDIEIKIDAAPASFFAIADVAEVLAPPTPWAVAPWQFALVFTLPPVLCLAGVWTWRQLFPSEARLTRQFRHASARRALNALRTGGAAWQIVCQYLQERFDFTTLDPTPAEVASFLKKRGFAKPPCELGRAFFQTCDAARFAKTAPPHLCEDAVNLIEALEAGPC